MSERTHTIGESTYYLIDEDVTNPHRIIIWKKRNDGCKELVREVNLEEERSEACS